MLEVLYHSPFACDNDSLVDSGDDDDEPGTLYDIFSSNFELCHCEIEISIISF